MPRETAGAGLQSVSHRVIHRFGGSFSAPRERLVRRAVDDRRGSAAAGGAVIVRALATMPTSPGVYRMLDAKGDALYVGKARSLKKRVTNYTQIGRLEERLRLMVSQTATMEIVTTHTEAEALLLEANLIKRLKPRFNIVLRDDKSYPWLMLTEDHAFPQIAKFRGTPGQGAQLLGAVRVRLGGEPDRRGDGAGVPAALLRRHGVPQPLAPLPAAPDQAVQRPVRRPDRSGELCQAGRAGQGVPAGPRRRRAGGTGGRDGGGGRPTWSTSAPPPPATASGR